MSIRAHELSNEDHSLLKKILFIGRELETLWPENGRAEEAALKKLKELIQLMRKAEQSEARDFKRLALYAEHLTSEMTARHLAAILVPFERLEGRALRDDEFLVTENDRAPEARSVAPLRVIADNLRSAFNVGAIIRTAEAFGAERVDLTGYTPRPSDERTARTSMGAADAISWKEFPRIEDAIAEARADGYKIVALETSASADDIENFQWPERAALLLGNERFGIEPAVLAEADHLVKIPLHGVKNSLNVGIAFGIAAASWRASLDQRAKGLWPLEAIGTLRARAYYPYEARRQGVLNLESDSDVIELHPRRNFEQALEDLQGFERVWLLYRFHHNPKWKPKVLPPRGPSGVKRGVFATRAPYRPNAIGLSCVELVRVEDRKIFIRGHDLLDGTPILDIKPYVPYADSFPNARAGWIDELENDRFKIKISAQAHEDFSWLEQAGVIQIRAFAIGQLEYAPLDHERKRVDSSDLANYTLAYRTWRIDFKLADARELEILGVRSGYSEQDLGNREDRYGDKELHRQFLARN